MKIWKTIRTWMTAAAAATMMLALPAVVQAEDPAQLDENGVYYDEENDVEYTFTVSGTKATLTEVSSLNSEYSVVVPGQVQTEEGVVANVTSMFNSKSGMDALAGNTEVVSADFSQTSIKMFGRNGGGSAGKIGFSGCSNLRSVRLPETLTALTNYLFQGCESLQTVEVPANVTNFGLMAAAETRMFEDCDNLQSITVAEGNKKFQSINGVLFSADGKTLYAWPNGKNQEEYTVPDTVTKIHHGAFETAMYLTTISIPKSVTEIGQYAFGGSGTTTQKNTKNSLRTAILYGTPKLGITPFINSQVAIIQKTTGVQITAEHTTMQVGETQTLTADVTPSEATDKSINWSVDNIMLASISPQGALTAKKAGVVNVTAEAADGSGAKDTVTITLEQPVIYVQSLTVREAQNRVQVTKDGKLSFQAMVNPSDATEQTVTWSVNNGTLADISADGSFQALAPGKVTVTATSMGGNPEVNGGKITADYQVEILKPVIRVSSVKVTAPRTELTTGESMTLTATVTPSDADNKKVTWSVDKSALASINTAGKLTAKAEGSVVVKATAQDGSKVYGTVTVRIKKKQQPAQPTQPTQPTVNPQQNKPKIEITKQNTTWLAFKWTSDKAATAGYRIYVKGGTAKKWTKVAETKATSYNWKKLKGKKLQSGTDYQLRVVSLKKQGSKKVEGRRLELKTSTALDKVKLTKVKKVKTGTVQLKWNKVRGAAGYELQMTTSKNGKYAPVKTFGKNTTSYKHGNLGKKKTIYYRMRAFKNVNGKRIYSGWTYKNIKI